MSDIWLAAVMGAQAIALALIARVRWRCHEDGTCTSGCTEHNLSPSSETVDVHEWRGGGQQGLVVSAKS